MGGTMAAQTWAFDLDLGKHSPAKFVLVALADYCDEQFSCFPGHGSIAKKTSMSVATVRRHLAWLEEHELISIGEQYRTNGSQRSNRYVLRVGAKLGGAQSAPPYESEQGPSTNLSTHGGVESEQGPSTNLSTLEPPIEPPYTNPHKNPHSRVRDEEFEKAWKHWPRSDRKKDAKAKFSKLENWGEVSSAIAAHGTAHRQYTPEQFVPHLVTWLNQERWNDPLPKPRNASEKQSDELGRLRQLREQERGGQVALDR